MDIISKCCEWFYVISIVPKNVVGAKIISYAMEEKELNVDESIEMARVDGEDENQ